MRDLAKSAYAYVEQLEAANEHWRLRAEAAEKKLAEALRLIEGVGDELPESTCPNCKVTHKLNCIHEEER